MTRDERLDRLSDEVRYGRPVDLSEALEVIDYQERLRKERDRARAATRIGSAMLGRLKGWIRFATQ
ncbi:MAG: hypothetical protein KDI55_00110 [Anaerolineae bacterium]|nr:hypothetical protein [Anaerolineae bacterium]